MSEPARRLRQHVYWCMARGGLRNKKQTPVHESTPGHAHSLHTWCLKQHPFAVDGGTRGSCDARGSPVVFSRCVTWFTRWCDVSVNAVFGGIRRQFCGTPLEIFCFPHTLSQHLPFLHTQHNFTRSTVHRCCSRSKVCLCTECVRITLL